MKKIVLGGFLLALVGVALFFFLGREEAPVTEKKVMEKVVGKVVSLKGSG